MILKNSILILAHPDDEILFASSLINDVKKIIIIYSATPNRRLSKNREKLINKYPLKKCIFLSLDESIGPKNLFYLLNGSETNYGVKIDDISYKNNKKNIEKKINNYINNCDTLITHNPWGEYGNHEHIQLHRIIRDIAFKKRLKLYVTGYASFASSNLMYMNDCLLKNKFFIKETNISLFKKLKQLYLETGCWTYSNSYEPPKIEIFYEIELSVEHKLKQIISPQKLQTSLPVNLINYRVFKKTIFFSFLPFLNSISIFLRNLLFYFIKD